MDPLATTDDLDARGITVPAGMDADVLLASASSAVREAAGCPISEVTATVTFVGDDWCTLDLPGPVTAVASVVVDSVPLTGWTLFGNTVRLPSGWARSLPTLITATWTFGLAEVPDDIVDLVCGMVSLAAGSDGDYGAGGRTSSVRLGDFSESYTPNPPGTESPSPMALPERTRQALAARFGTSAAAVRVG